MNNVEESVAAVAPYLAGALVSAENLAHIASVARRMPCPLPSIWGFECPLGSPEARGDFAICFRASGAEHGMRGRRDSTDGSSCGHAVWTRLERFCREWETPTSALHGRINDVWLEFDVAGGSAALPVPNVFVGPESGSAAELHGWVAEVALPLLLGHALPDELGRKLLESLSRMPAAGRAYQLGVMFARQSRGVRLCLCGIAAGELPGYLNSLGWTGSVKDLATVVSRFAELAKVSIVGIDLAETVGPRIGLEFSFFSAAQPGDPRSSLFLRYLVERGLCLPEKCDAVLAWPGYTPCVMGPPLLPEHLTQGAIFSSLTGYRILARRLSHIKLSYQADRSLEAKAYLSCRVIERPSLW